MKYNARHAVVKAFKSLPGWARITAPAVTVLALAGGGAVYAAGAGAATNACSFHCIDISFLATGHHWLLNDAKGRTTVNAVVSQQQGSNGGNAGRNEDFQYYDEGTIVPTYCPDGSTPALDPIFTPNQCTALKNAGLASDNGYQLEYVPFGGESSGLCLGTWNATVPLPSASTWLARLQPCGDAADTVLIGADALDNNSWHTTGGSDWVISGASNNFSNPEVLGNNGIQQWQNLTWQPIHINGNAGEDNQEIRATNGPY